MFLFISNLVMFVSVRYSFSVSVRIQILKTKFDYVRFCITIFVTVFSFLYYKFLSQFFFSFMFVTVFSFLFIFKF